MKQKVTYIPFLLWAVIFTPDLISGGHFLFYHHQVAPNYFNETHFLQRDVAQHCPYLEHKFYPVSLIKSLFYRGYLATFFCNYTFVKNAIPELPDKFSYLLRGPPFSIQTIAHHVFR